MILVIGIMILVLWTFITTIFSMGHGTGCKQRCCELYWYWSTCLYSHRMLPRTPTSWRPAEGQAQIAWIHIQLLIWSDVKLGLLRPSSAPPLIPRGEPRGPSYLVARPARVDLFR